MSGTGAAIARFHREMRSKVKSPARNDDAAHAHRFGPVSFRRIVAKIGAGGTTVGCFRVSENRQAENAQAPCVLNRVNGSLFWRDVGSRHSEAERGVEHAGDTRKTTAP